MRDQDQRDLGLLLQLVDQLEDQAALAGAHGGERLVEEQDARRRVGRAGDRDRLPLAARELVGLCIDARHAHVDLVEVLPGELSHRSLVEEMEAPHGRQLVVQEEVQVDRELRDQREVLVDGLDPELARSRG